MIPAAAFILMGGKSQRFGSPKWKAQLNNETILDRIWKTCDIFQEKVIIGKEDPKIFGKPFIKDLLLLDAPINGLYSGILQASTEWIFLLSCDIPLIDKSIIEKLWGQKAHDSKCIIPIAFNKNQVTCAFYHKNILSQIESAINFKSYSLQVLIDNLNPSTVDFKNDKRFFNMNTKEDLDQIKKLTI